MNPDSKVHGERDVLYENTFWVIALAINCCISLTLLLLFGFYLSLNYFNVH